MSTLTPEFFDALIVAVIIIGVALAVVRLRRDFTRPLPPPRPPFQQSSPPIGSPAAGSPPPGANNPPPNVR